MTTTDGSRQLFTQATYPNALTPSASPYDSPHPVSPFSGPQPPAGAYGSAPGGIGYPGRHGQHASGGNAHAQSPYAPVQYGAPPAASPTGQPPQHAAVITPPPPTAAPMGFALQHPTSPEIQEAHSPTNYFNEKTMYRTQPEPLPAGAPLSANPQGPMAYHQIVHTGAPAPFPTLKSQSPPPVSRQPAAMAPMGVNANMNTNGPRYNTMGEREWTHGLFDCCDDAGTCAIATCAPCLAYGQIKSRINHLNRHGGVPHPTGGEMFNEDCMIYSFLTCWGIGWVLQIGSRSTVRNRYRIHGTGSDDFIAAFCCTPCDLTQQSLELAQEERAHNRGASMQF